MFLPLDVTIESGPLSVVRSPSVRKLLTRCAALEKYSATPLPSTVSHSLGAPTWVTSWASKLGHVKSGLESLDFHAEPIPIHLPYLRLCCLSSSAHLYAKIQQVLWLNALPLEKKTHWSGLVTRNFTPEEDVQRYACPAPPRHTCQCNGSYIET